MITELNKYFVSILTVVDGTHNRIAYINTIRGREAVLLQQSPEVVEEIMSVWGGAPTTDDNTPMIT